MTNIIESMEACGHFTLANAAEWFCGATQGTASKCIDIPKSLSITAQIRFKTQTSDGRAQYLFHDIHKPVVIKTKSESPVFPPR